MDQVKSNFFENQILEAIETVANGIVSKIKFDQTILCTITNDEKRKKGIYEVTDGTSTFEACSNDDSYREDMIVYVLIPQGDYENQKTIIGKYVDDTSSAINYISMMDSFISVNGSSNIQEYSLIANHPDRRFINIPIDVDYLKETNQYNCVGIQADFKTDLSQEHIIAGNYGLILTLYGEDVSTEQPIPIPPKSYVLDCSEMYGDPYNYNFYFTQSMVFDLAKDFANTKITNATISFYQNKNFKTLDNKELSYTYSTTHTYIDENGTGQKEEIISREKQPNLFVKNVVLKFGYNLSDITEESIRLYSLNDTKYISRSNKKNISLKWFVKNEVEEKLPYLIIDNKEEAANKTYEDLIGDYSIYWYRYKIDNSEKDPLAGVYWNIISERIYNDKTFIENGESEKNELMYALEENPKGKYAKVNDDAENGALILATDKNKIKYDVVEILSGKRYSSDTVLDEQEEPFEYTFGPNELLSREKIKAILVRNEWREVLTEGKDDDDNIYVHFEDASKYYESNELVYENANPASQNLASVDLIRNMRLECQDGSNGIYKVYNSVDNKALGNEANRIRILNVIFDTYSTIDIPTAELENCSVKWKIPKNNSMIEPVDFSFTGPVVIQNPNNENKIKGDNKSETTIITWKTENSVPYYECSYSWSSDIVGKDEHYEGVSLQANYRIKEDYSQAYNNNTIICEITKYNRIYKAEIEFLFGESGTNGTGYTLSIRLDKEYDSTGNVSLTPVSCITADTNKKVKLVATLFDQFGNDISDQQTVSWNFKNGINKGFVLDSDYIKYDETEVISECYGIVMATSTVKWKEKMINLQAYLPIGIKPKDSDIFTYNGTTKIIYDAQGTQSTYQQIHNLYDKEDKDIPVNKWQVSVLDQGVDENWSEYIPYFVKEITENSTETTENSKKTTNILAAKNMYFTELSTKQIVIQALDDKDNVLYQQSILYDQNRFGSALFNEWDGSLIVDEAGNKILSALIGAGKKDNNNTFTGVVMGKTTTNSGLIGYSKGVQTFGFDTDGTAFIGASGKGRIEFNGTTGTIQSGNYKNTKEGIKIDLDDGKFELNPTKILKTDLDGQKEIDFINSLQSAYIQINTNKDPYFEIKTISSINKDENGEYIYETIDGTQYLTYKYTPLISIGKNEYYLQSKNFSDTSTSKTGVKLDLNSGKLYGYDFLIQAGQGDKKLIIDSDSTKPLTIGTNFKVGWDGKIEATEGKFSGKITASSGNIGGWTIVKNALYKNTSGNIEESTEEGNKNKLIKYKAVSGSAIIAPAADVMVSDLTAFKVWEYTSGDSTQNTPGGSDGPTITTTTEGKWSQSAVTASNIVFSIGKNFAINKDGTIYASGAQLDGIVYKDEVDKLSDTLIKIAQGKLDWETYYRETADNKLDGRIGTVNLNNNGLISQIGEYNGKSIFVDHTIASGRTYVVEGYYGDEKTFYDKTIGYETEISPLSKYQSYYDIDNKQYYKSYDNNTLTPVDKTSADIDKDFVIRGYYYNNKIYQKKKYVRSSSTVSKDSSTIYLDIDTGLAYLYESSKFRLTTPDDNIVMFMVNNKGLLTAANAVIAGTIYAHDGYIGGWTIQHVSNKGGLTYGNNNKKGDLSTNPWEIGDTGANLTPGNGLYVENRSLFGQRNSIKQCVFNVGQKFAVDTNGVLYASDGTFNGKITANEGAIGNWQILKTGELKGTPSNSKAEYKIILNPNYVEDAKKKFSFQINNTTVSFDIAASDSVGAIQKNFEDAVRKQTGNNSFSWNNLPPISQTILLMQFIYVKMLLIDSNIFKIKNTGSNMIFGIDGNGFLNWRFYNSNTFTNETNRFIIRANSDSLNITWIDWTKENIDHQAAWSFTSDGSLNLSKLKSISYKDDLGGFQLYGEDASDKFWNNSLFTTNTINTASNKYSHYVGFLRAVGSSSQSLASTFIGCKQYDNNNDTWPSNDNWSSSSAYYNFYIRFDGTAKFKTLSTDTLSTKRINAAIPGITATSQGRDYALIRLTSSSGNYSYYRPLFSLQGITSGKSWDFGINPRKDAIEDSQYQYVDELFLCGFSSFAYSNSGKASFSLGIGRKWTSDIDNDESVSGYNYIIPRTKIKLGTSKFKWQEIWCENNSLNTSSDIRLKEVQDDNYLRKLLIVYNNIKPIAYKKKNIKPEDNHDRIHIGFSAQNIELELSKVSLTPMDFAGLGIDPTNDPFFEDGKQYSLRYGEFHGLHVLKNQEQDKRILELEQKVQQLENKILELREKGV